MMHSTRTANTATYNNPSIMGHQTCPSPRMNRHCEEKFPSVADIDPGKLKLHSVRVKSAVCDHGGTSIGQEIIGSADVRSGSGAHISARFMRGRPYSRRQTFAMRSAGFGRPIFEPHIRLTF